MGGKCWDFQRLCVHSVCFGKDLQVVREDFREKETFRDYNKRLVRRGNEHVTTAESMRKEHLETPRRAKTE